MDIRQIMKQAQQMQQRMAQVQEELGKREITAAVAGGQVSVTMTGKHEVVRIEIRPDAVDPADVEFLQDLVAAAVNEAVRQVDEMVQKEMSSLTGGLNLPGLPGMGG